MEQRRLPPATFGRTALYAIAAATNRSPYALQAGSAPTSHAYDPTTQCGGDARNLFVPRAIRSLDVSSNGIGAATPDYGDSLIRQSHFEFS
jgi:hypothetical protein